MFFIFHACQVARQLPRKIWTEERVWRVEEKEQKPPSILPNMNGLLRELEIQKQLDKIWEQYNSFMNSLVKLHANTVAEKAVAV